MGHKRTDTFSSPIGSIRVMKFCIFNNHADKKFEVAVRSDYYKTYLASILIQINSLRQQLF